MSTHLSAVQLDQLRRDAKRLSRSLSIPHSAALDRIAAQHSFNNWSLLTKHSAGGAQRNCDLFHHPIELGWVQVPALTNDSLPKPAHELVQLKVRKLDTLAPGILDQ